MLQLLKPVHLEPMFHNKRSQRNKPTHCNEELSLLAATKAHTHAHRHTWRYRGGKGRVWGMTERSIHTHTHAKHRVEGEMLYLEES